MVTQELVLIPALIPARPWTLVSYMFLHANFSHILFNMLGLFFFGPRLEAQLGSSRFLAVYFGSGIVGGLLSFLTPLSPIVGASGAVYGVTAGFAHHWPHEAIYIWGMLPVRAWLYIVIMAAMSIFGGFGGDMGNIAHFAHLGGIAGGYALVRVFESRPRQKRWSSNRPPSFSRGDLDRWSRIQREKLHEVNRAEFDRIMAKIHEEGVGSLTGSERVFLDNFSNRV